MNKVKYIFLITLLSLITISCDSLRFINIQTQEPAMVSLPSNVRSLLVVNNTSIQPDDFGHSRISGNKVIPLNLKADSLAIFYTEALTQFLKEEKYFDNVILYSKPLRTDDNYTQEKPILPEKMMELNRLNGTDAVLSVDKLLEQVNIVDLVSFSGENLSNMVGKIQSTVRLYKPTTQGDIPAINFKDSINWAGIVSPEINKYNLESDIIPHPQTALKLLAVKAADKVSKVFAPHWEEQRRWFYALDKNGTAYMEKLDWANAKQIWENLYNTSTNNLKKARAANNLALTLEMMDDLQGSLQWANIARDLFQKANSGTSTEYRLAELYRTEIERRITVAKNVKTLN